MKTTVHLAIGLASAAAITAAAVAAPAIPGYVTAAVAGANRPDADKQRDDGRKPAETIAFAGLKPGQSIADFLPGTGYYDRIFSGVVGAKGHVYAFYPAEMKAFSKSPLPADGTKPFDKYDNVTSVSTPANDFALPAPVDMVWISDNYHDIHDPFFAPAEAAKVNAAVFKALKPGGIYLVLDHAGAGGLRPCRHQHPAPHRRGVGEERGRGRRLPAGRGERRPAQRGRRSQQAGVRPLGPRPHRPVHPEVPQAEGLERVEAGWIPK
jgi:predicted methyltransferase